MKKKKVASSKKKLPKKLQKQFELVKKNKKLAYKIDLRLYKSYPHVKQYIKSIREGYKENQWNHKLNKYLAVSLVEYYRLYNQPELIKNLPKTIGISWNTFSKLLRGGKVGKNTYKKFNNFLANKISNYETAFLFRIAEVLKKNRGKISLSTIKLIVNELYEFLNYSEYDSFGNLDYYDYLHIYY